MRQVGENKYGCIERTQTGVFRRLLVAGLLLTVMLHPQVWNSWALLLRAKIRSEVHRLQVSGHSEKDTPVLIKIPLCGLKGQAPASLIWIETDEFRYQGQLYDVLSVETCGDTLWYYCHHDKAETSLMNGLFEKIEADAPATASAQLKWTPGFLFEQWQVSAPPFFPAFIMNHCPKLNTCHRNVAGRMREAPLPPPPQRIFSS